jgi:carboxyl-terminal processing protease
MISRLGQSHFAILPGEDMLEAEPAPQSPAAVPADAPNAPPAKPTRARKRDAEPGVTGATLTLLPAPKSDSAAASPPAWEAVITHIAPDSEAAKAQLLPGTVVLAVDGKSILRDLPQGEGLERYEREAIIDARGTGAPHSKSTWRVRTPDGKERDVELRFAADARPTTKFGNLPPIHCSLSWTELDPLVLQRHEAGEARIGAITFDSWFMPVAKPFDQAVDKLRQADGIILDLRGNPGGFGGMAMGIAGHFTPNAETLGSMIMRDSTLNFVTNPRLVSADGKPVNVFEGPVAILVDTGTASTSEIFAGGMQHLTRARIFGSRTAGAALPAIFV